MACHHKKTLLRTIFKNALSGRFFICISLFIYHPFSLANDYLSEECASTHFHEKAYIDYVIDGDTVVLKDKRHIRLIGIDTPELNYDGIPSEPGAEIARDRLIALITDNKQINLRFDTEKRDRHGRTLAHLFREDGINIQAQMLNAGLAMSLVIPPNLLHVDCYLTQAKIAKQNKRGLWALPRYQSVSTSQLSGHERGFHFISGSVKRINESRSAIWLNLEHNVALRIVRDDLHYFNLEQLQSLQDKRVEAKGWLYRKKGQLRMRIRHNSDITIIK